MHKSGMRQSVTHFKDVSPVLTLVVQSLVEHLHDLNEVVPMRMVRHNHTTQASHTYWL